MDKAGKKKDEQLAKANNQFKTKQRAQNNPGVFVTAKGTTALKTLSNDLKPAKKRKRCSKDKAEPSSPSKSKKLKATSTTSTALTALIQSTVSENQWSFEWSDYSCAYNSLFAILLHAVYNSSNELWSVCAGRMPLLESLLEASQAAISSQLPIESARDRIRLELHQADLEEFPLHTSQGTDIYTLCSYMLEQYYDYQYMQYTCTLCDSTQKTASSSN